MSWSWTLYLKQCAEAGLLVLLAYGAVAVFRWTMKGGRR